MMGAPRPKQLMPIGDYIPRRNSAHLTPEQREEQIERTRTNLLVWLNGRRRRLGMTEQDVRESPENVLRKQQAAAAVEVIEVDISALRTQQGELIREYMQTQDSRVMM